jgi:hypothetical protein
MAQSTPINLIRNSDSSMAGINSMTGGDSSMGNMSSDSQLVEDILKEMGESPGADQQSNINSQAFQYTMDSAQVPPTKYTPPQHNTSGPEYTNYTQKVLMENNNGFLGTMGINLNGNSLKEKIMNNIKYPVVVFVIGFLISLPEFNRFLFGFFPRLLLESGQVSIGGVLLKALVGMILFSIIVLFI